MRLYQTTEYLYTKKKLLKKKKCYACIDAVIEEFLASEPTFQEVCESGSLVQTGSGKSIYKLRLMNRTMKQGKRGGYRILIACNSKTESVTFLTVYGKTGSLEKKDLESDELVKLLKGLKKNIKENDLVEYLPLIKKAKKSPKRAAPVKGEEK